MKESYDRHYETGSSDREPHNELKADPAHPAPVQGSDSGRAQGETAKERTTKKESRVSNTPLSLFEGYNSAFPQKRASIHGDFCGTCAANTRRKSVAGLDGKR